MTSQPCLIVYAVVQEEEDVSIDAQEMLVIVAMDLVQALDEASLDRDSGS